MPKIKKNTKNNNQASLPVTMRGLERLLEAEITKSELLEIALKASEKRREELEGIAEKLDESLLKANKALSKRAVAQQGIIRRLRGALYREGTLKEMHQQSAKIYSDTVCIIHKSASASPLFHPQRELAKEAIKEAQSVQGIALSLMLPNIYAG